MPRPTRQCYSCKERMNPNAFPRGSGRCYGCIERTSRRQREEAMPANLQQLRPLLDTKELNAWERGFVSDLVERFLSGRTRRLSSRQSDKLAEIAQQHEAS